MSFLEEYTLLEELGQGGFATVYKVRHNELGYIRAIRVLNATITSEQDPTYRKFKEECRLLLRLGNGNHPNIVHIYQPLLRAQKAIVEMDYVDGEDLFHYLERNKNFIPTEDVLRMLREIGSALAYCHYDIYRFSMDREEDDLKDDPNDGSKILLDDKTLRRLVEKYRVIHNDIHSGNIIRREDGSYVLLDFGLAIEGGNVVRSSRRQHGGAPEFKSPEKWEDETVLTTESDIYSFGVVLYELLAGRVPFQFDKKISSYKAEYQLGEAHKSQQPEPIEPLRRALFEATHPNQSYEKDYPDWLEELIMKCLAKNPQDRFHSAKELYEYVMQQTAASATQVKIVEKEVVKNIIVPDEKSAEEVIRLRNLINDIQNKKVFSSDAELQFAFNENKKLVKLLRQQVDKLAAELRIKEGKILTLKTQITELNSEIERLTKASGGTLPLSNNATTKDFVETALGLNMNMVYVEGGTFVMGALADDKDAYDNEKPPHMVTLNSYHIAQFEVTQSQWQKVMGTTIQQQNKLSDYKGLYGVGDDYPMYHINHAEATAFCERLSVLTGKIYKLPTEAQWEFAARGGANNRTYRYSGGSSIDDVAWHIGSGGEKSHHVVGEKHPNGLGLYDMNGNVWEWCEDWYGVYEAAPQIEPRGAAKGEQKVFRGGSWYDVEKNCTVTFRSAENPEKRMNNVGFRVVMISSQTQEALPTNQAKKGSSMTIWKRIAWFILFLLVAFMISAWLANEI